MLILFVDLPIVLYKKNTLYLNKNILNHKRWRLYDINNNFNSLLYGVFTTILFNDLVFIWESVLMFFNNNLVNKSLEVIKCWIQNNLKIAVNSYVNFKPLERFIFWPIFKICFKLVLKNNNFSSFIRVLCVQYFHMTYIKTKLFF